MIPSIGHTGICTSKGIIHDFAGPYYISVNDMAFGRPLKYIKLDIPIKESIKLDKAINDADKIFEKRNHNLFW